MYEQQIEPLLRSPCLSFFCLFFPPLLPHIYVYIYIYMSGIFTQVDPLYLSILTLRTNAMKYLVIKQYFSPLSLSLSFYINPNNIYIHVHIYMYIYIHTYVLYICIYIIGYNLTNKYNTIENMKIGFFLLLVMFIVCLHFETIAIVHALEEILFFETQKLILKENHISFCHYLPK